MNEMCPSSLSERCVHQRGVNRDISIQQRCPSDRCVHQRGVYPTEVPIKEVPIQRCPSNRGFHQRGAYREVSI